MHQSNSKIIVICGPTCSGKSDVANNLAYRIDGEVVSADSMQIYKGMDIGTGKISTKNQLVKHYCLDIIAPDQSYSAALFQQDSRKCFNKIWQNHKTPILCGGTGFYIRAAIDDYSFPDGEQTNNQIREKYNKFLKEHGAMELWNLLYSKDPASAKKIHPNNSVRVVRALELAEDGKSYALQLNNLKNLPQKYSANFYALSIDRDKLYKRINLRVDKMVEEGLVEEVRLLLNKNYRKSLTSVSAIGYKEIVDYLDGKSSLDQSIEQIKKATRNYAKRQLTWFRKDKRITWLDFNDLNVDRAVSAIINSK